MDEQIKALLNQVRILEEEANNHSGAERAELFKAAGKLKNQVATMLNQQGKGKAESKVPGLDYFDNKLDPAFGDYFSGDYLTDDMRDYFTVKVPDNMPDERPSTETPKSYEMDEDVRRRIFNAIGIPC
ncbi:hypothetical protein C9091_01025 [Escherichia coli]|nr:hypothetical protein [Escherichia coli]TJK35178.1 hypothetical protein C9092_15185 [Escherichia coli]TJK53475.1 hypothetical protein C9091_01025 [Escherichia coli]